MAWEKKDEDSRIFFTLYYFSPFPWCVKNQPHDGVLLLCLLLSLFEWVHIFLAWKSGAQSWFKEKKKMKVYFVLYKCWEVLAIFFSVIFFFFPFKSHWSFNKFLLKCLGRIVKCLHPNPPESAWEDGGVDRYISLFCLSPPPPVPFPILRYFSWKELVRTSRDGVVWIVGGEVRVLSKLFNVPFPSSALSLLKSIQRLLSHLF